MYVQMRDLLNRLLEDRTVEYEQARALGLEIMKTESGRRTFAFMLEQVRVSSPSFSSSASFPAATFRVGDSKHFTIIFSYVLFDSLFLSIYLSLRRRWRRLTWRHLLGSIRRQSSSSTAGMVTPTLACSKSPPRAKVHSFMDKVDTHSTHNVEAHSVQHCLYLSPYRGTENTHINSL